MPSATASTTSFPPLVQSPPAKYFAFPVWWRSLICSRLEQIARRSKEGNPALQEKTDAMLGNSSPTSRKSSSRRCRPTSVAGDRAVHAAARALPGGPGGFPNLASAVFRVYRFAANHPGWRIPIRAATASNNRPQLEVSGEFTFRSTIRSSNSAFAGSNCLTNGIDRPRNSLPK